MGLGVVVGVVVGVVLGVVFDLPTPQRERYTNYGTRLRLGIYKSSRNVHHFLIFLRHFELDSSWSKSIYMRTLIAFLSSNPVPNDSLDFDRFTRCAGASGCASG